MKWFRIATLLVAVLLLQPACRKKEPPPPEETTTTGPDVASEKKDVIVCLTGTGAAIAADPREAKVKDKNRQRFSWRAHGNAYTLYFQASNWEGIKGDHDGTQTIGSVEYKLVKVPKDGTSNWYTLDYTAPAAGRPHNYRIDTDPTTNVLPPPNGPAIIGGD